MQFRILRKTHHESDGPASSDMWFTWAMRQCLEPECTESWPESPDRASVIRQIWLFGPKRRVVVNHPNHFLICPDEKKIQSLNQQYKVGISLVGRHLDNSEAFYKLFTTIRKTTVGPSIIRIKALTSARPCRFTLKHKYRYNSKYQGNY